MKRPRACAAILKDENILMVKEVYPDKTFWTLPGGGLENGETFEEAAVREVKEEVIWTWKLSAICLLCNTAAGKNDVF